MKYTKEDVQTHSDGFGRGSNPAVNVKIYATLESEKLPLDLGSSYPVGHPELIEHHKTDPGFTHEWVRENVSDEALNAFFWQACANGVEECHEIAREIFGPVDLWQEGRSGGWLVIPDLAPIEEWDAVALAKWRKFENYCRTVADGIPYVVLSVVYINFYERRMEVARASGYRSA